MENLGPPAFNPHLKRVLKSYQTVSMNSLNGPSSHVSGWADPKLSPSEISSEYRKTLHGPMLKTRVGEEKMDYLALPIPTQSIPLFLPMDATRGEQSETELEGEKIACFIVGGERRLCLPQILNTVLNDFTLQQINAVCDELHMYCSRSNPEQLQSFKMQRVLPWSAPSCGLITKTDAERLCNALLHHNPEKARNPPSPGSFKVYHECFGKCKGIFSPELYTSSLAKCIECVDCHGMFSPQKFVSHSHKALENRTCHWGFESSNWRSYMLLSKDQEYRDRYQDVLLEMKARFDTTNQYKRKEIHTDKDGAKRQRVEDPRSWPDSIQQLSAFRPWSPNGLALKDGKGLPLPQYDDIQSLPGYLHRGPPVLLNPERVVPHSESTRYERHFAPNVSLAPAPYQKLKEEVDERGAKESTPIPMMMHDQEDVKPDISSMYHSQLTRSSHEELEIDVSSSDTESSIKSESTTWSAPHDGTRSGLLSPASDDEVPATEKAEVEILRRAFELKGDKENQEKLLDEFRHLYIARNRKIITLNDRVQKELIEKNLLEREIAVLKQRSKEAMDKSELAHSKKLTETVEELELQHEKKMAAVHAERNSLRNEIEKLKRTIEENMVSSGESELQAKLNIAEQSNKQLQQQVALLQEEIHRLSRATPCGDNPEDLPTATEVKPEVEAAVVKESAMPEVSTAS